MLNKTNLANGVYTVLVTPFNGEDYIDYDSLFNLVEYGCKSNIAGFILLGTTSETPTLDTNEQVELVQRVYKKINKRKPVIVGVGGNNTKQCGKMVNILENFADAFMVTTPNYNKPTEKGVYLHFLNVCCKSQKPFMLYNVPSRCGINLSPELVAKCYSTISNVVAIKEASGSLNQVLQIRNLCNIQVFSGDDALLVPMMSVGASGVISVASNVIPDLVHKVYSLCQVGSYKDAHYYYNQTHSFIKNLFYKTNPVPVKEVLAYYRFIDCKKVRLPLVGLDNDEFSVVINHNSGLSQVPFNVNNLRCDPVLQFSHYMDSSDYNNMLNNVANNP